MLEGYYSVASGMLTRQRELNVIGNNLVNTQTPGYRTERLLTTSFEQELFSRMEGTAAQPIGAGAFSTSAVVDSVVPLFQEGIIKPTDRNMDIAIVGEGFYNIRGADGQTYLTRNGAFNIDSEGYLTLPGFGRVLGESGVIYVENENFSVDADGTVYSDEDQRIGKLLLTVPPENSIPVKAANGLFQMPGGTQSQAARNYTLSQSSLELSNVDMNQELANLMEAQRAFQSCSSALQLIDSLNRRAATQLAAL